MKIKYKVKPLDDYSTWQKGDTIYWKEGFDEWDLKHFGVDKLEENTPYKIRSIRYITFGMYEGQYLLDLEISSARDYSAASFTKIRP